MYNFTIAEASVDAYNLKEKANIKYKELMKDNNDNSTFTVNQIVSIVINQAYPIFFFDCSTKKRCLVKILIH